MTNTGQAAQAVAEDVAQALAWRMAHVDNGVFGYRDMMAADEEAAREEDAHAHATAVKVSMAQYFSDRGVRAAKVATIHALADWYAQHPEQPMPDKITCVRVIEHHEIPDESTRLGMLKVWADANGVHVQDNGLYDQWAIYQVADPALTGMTVSMYVSAMLDHKNGTK